MNRAALAVCVLLSLFALVHSGAAQDSPEPDEEVTAATPPSVLIPYPTLEELDAEGIDSSSIAFEPLSASDINADFSNIGDLEWLRVPAKKNRAILLGENHYFRTTQHIRNRIFFALNQFDRYPLLILEHQWSATPFLDYYVRLEDDAEAKRFFEKNLVHAVSAEEDKELLDHVRDWNKSHPDQLLSVAGHDIEHRYERTVEDIVLPWFRHANPKFNIRRWDRSPRGLGIAVRYMRAFLKEMGDEAPVGEYPFLTRDYIEAVIDNLESFSRTRTIEFWEYRQKAMIRNLTDPRYLGRRTSSAKFMIHGGSWHTNLHDDPDSQRFRREGDYLEREYEPTEGKVYTISVTGIALRMGPMANFVIRDSAYTGSGYRRIQRAYQAAAEIGAASPETYYLFMFGRNPCVDRFIHAGWRNNNAPYRLVVDGSDQNAPMPCSVFSGAPSVLDENSKRSGHDATIILPVSDIQRLRTW